MHTPLDVASLSSALDATHAVLVDLESAITEAEQREARMTSADAATQAATAERFAAFATRNTAP